MYFRPLTFYTTEIESVFATLMILIQEKMEEKAASRKTPADREGEAQYWP